VDIVTNNAVVVDGRAGIDNDITPDMRSRIYYGASHYDSTATNADLPAD
jgi:hypothetical protein